MIGLVWLGTFWVVPALCEDQFVPPQPYPVTRYEEGWNKNPFTIKTAPIGVTKASFAENLAIGSYYGASNDPTIVVVNTKTGERTRLKSSVESNGMMLKSVSLGASRKESTAVVTCGAEMATLHYDDTYVRQVAAEGDRQGVGAGTPSTPSGPGAIVDPARIRGPSPALGGGVVSTGNSPMMGRSQAQPVNRGPVIGGSVMRTGAPSTPPPSAASRTLHTAPTRRVLTAPQAIR